MRGEQRGNFDSWRGRGLLGQSGPDIRSSGILSPAGLQLICLSVIWQQHHERQGLATLLSIKLEHVRLALSGAQEVLHFLYMANTITRACFCCSTHKHRLLA